VKRYQIRGENQKHWFFLFLLMDIFFIFLIWLVGDGWKTFSKVSVIIFIFTLFIFCVGYGMTVLKQKRQVERAKQFLKQIDETTEQRLIEALDDVWHPIVRTATLKVREQGQLIKQKELELRKYEEFVEAWVHKIKTPISLATLVLANHRTEMSPYAYNRMEYVRHAIANDVAQILYYARLQADHVDYKFNQVSLNEIIRECIEDFQGLAEEKQVRIELDLTAVQIMTDKKVLLFMLTQILSNAFKYTAKKNGNVKIMTWINKGSNGKIHLAVRDNGDGVPLEDVPFLFDKGFTGGQIERQDATGMGLYLVKKYAELLSIDVVIEEVSISGKGFGIELVFPLI